MTTTDLIAGLETVRDAHYADLAAGRPLCDGPRLVLADALEESGECDRAELIRVECELAAIAAELQSSEDCDDPNCLPCKDARELRRREKELLETNANGVHWLPRFGGIWGHSWAKAGEQFLRFKIGNGPNANAEWYADVEFHRGFPSRLRLPRLTDWIGRVCERCGGSGSILTSGPSARLAGVRRIHIDCPTCHGTGRIAGLGPRLVRAVPVERVEFGNKRPSPAGKWCGWAWDGDHDEFDLEVNLGSLPKPIWELLENWDRDDPPDETGGWKWYPTADAARLDLSRAAILHAMGKEPTA